jgi:mannose-6-phosphate isomerase
VYDYGRVDKNGNLRQLHLEKALKVTNLQKTNAAAVIASDGAVLGECEYFLAQSVFVRGDKRISAWKNSFACFTCVRGQGEINGERTAQGDSFFVPAGEQEIYLSGDMDVIVSRVPDKK